MLRAAGGVPASLFCYYEDTDTSWRLRLASYQVLAMPDAQVSQVGGASTRHGTAAFHRWNERNRLLVPVRCAPAGTAARELAEILIARYQIGRRAAISRMAVWSAWARPVLTLFHHHRLS